MQQNCRVIVPDVRSDACFNAESRNVVLRAGVLSVQSTPLISSSGRLLGVLSTHSSVPAEPSPASLPFLDRLARRTARLLESNGAATVQV
jgi:GAF domain-containing protein